ncbi:uncharacterized protein LOC6554584 [Drosophila erecta]|uniref:GG12113 n=1 Tax=Drosophila erecta TaxID=7220 RepID=B3P610_DROER|nr:uncharacterized protein LOC6554584 [Drosophila erecta]EDV53410.1 uncharacterized protein Dere_GG12113 [Drosophila erecta]
MKLLIWLCLLGCLASVHGIFLDKIADSSENGLLDGIFGLEDSDTSSHNKTLQHASPPTGILTPVELAAEVVHGVWDAFSKGVLGLLGSFTSGDDGGDSPATGNTASATTESTPPSQETTTTRISTESTTESRTEATVETTTTASSTSTTPP